MHLEREVETPRRTEQIETIEARTERKRDKKQIKHTYAQFAYVLHCAYKHNSISQKNMK